MRTLSLIFALAAATTTLACSGRFAESDADAGAGDGGQTTDASPADGGTTDASPTTECPSSLPAIGSPCSRESLQCEYGGSFYAGCDKIVQCTNGSWQSESFSFYCPNGPNPSGCPQSMNDVPVGEACSLPQGTSCHYDRGQCYCGILFGPPQPIDGGTRTWSCDSPGAGCPMPRPMLGTSCAQEGQMCMYQECEFAQQCTKGVWSAEPIACAGAGGGH